MKQYVCSSNGSKYTLNLGLGFFSGEGTISPEGDTKLTNTIKSVFDENNIAIDDIEYYDWDDMYEDSVIELQDEAEDDEEPHYEQILEGLIDIPDDAYDRGFFPVGVEIDIRCSNISDKGVRDTIIAQLSDLLPKLGYVVESASWG